MFGMSPPAHNNVMLVLQPTNPRPPAQIGGRIRPTSPICSADLLGFWILPICSANFQTAGTLITDRLNTYGSPWSALRDITYTQKCSPSGVQIGIFRV